MFGGSFMIRLIVKGNKTKDGFSPEKRPWSIRGVAEKRLVLSVP